ncbi:MAG: endonuclease MutS2 [Acidobacteriota bacterium]
MRAREALELLGFPEVIRLLQDLTQSEMGKAFMARTRPLRHGREVGERLSLVEESTRYRLERGSVSLSGLRDPQTILANLSVEGQFLQPEQFLILLDLLRIGFRLEREFQPEQWPRLARRWGSWPFLGELVTAIEQVVDAEGEIQEGADPELRRVRRELSRSRQRAQHHLRGYFSGQRAKSLIRDPFITQRNHRYVIPVRVERQRELPGVVHGISSSGATLFVEPFSAVELNNKCLQCLEREEEIIRRILLALTDLLRPYSAGMEELARRVADVDVLQACAEFTIKYRCVIPSLSESRKLTLREARHPLLIRNLGEKNVVPVSVQMGPGANVLVISGPNTGGKTVALKTVGLFALLVQSGLPVPAAEAEFPVFRQVLADIGDRQSISDNLSTFSAHILRVKRMMESLDPPSLILLDEIGAGTDPVYGAALGIAIIDYFHSRETLVVATTHHHSIKQFATHTAGVENASVELDPVSLKPTFELKFGIAGGSSALEIAQQLGLERSLVDQARGLLEERHVQVERYLAGLRTELRSMEQSRRELRQQIDSVKRREAVLQEGFERRERKRQKEAEKALEKWSLDFRQETERFVKSVKDRFESARLRQQAKQKEKALKEAFRRKMLSRVKVESAGEARPSSEDLEEGDWVYSSAFRKRGRVLAIRQKEALVEMDAKKITVPVRQLARIEETPSPPPSSRHVILNVVENSEPELNLVGHTVAEALEKTDKFLDRAFLSQLHEVRLIHGFGTGRLRKALSRFLLDHPQVLKHRVEGGVTRVDLRV